MQTFPEWLIEHLPKVVRGLMQHYREFDEGCCEDAVCEAMFGMWQDYEELAPIWDRGDRGLLMHFLQVRAWRNLRGLWRRCDHARVDMVADVEGLPGVGSPEWALLSHLAAQDGIERACRVHGSRHANPMLQALREHLLHGYTCSEAAVRHGVRREYLSRAKRLMREDLEGILDLAA